MHIVFTISKKYAEFISKNKKLADTVRGGIFNKERWIKEVYTDLDLQKMMAAETGTISFNPQLQPGTYFFILGINVGHNNATHNSRKIKLVVE